MATWFTFLPSFVFILAGGPFVERTRDDVHLEGPLSGHHGRRRGRDREPRGLLRLARVLAGRERRAPFPRGFDWPSVAIAAVALAALVKNRAGVMPVIAGSALAGVALKALARRPRQGAT